MVDMLVTIMLVMGGGDSGDGDNVEDDGDGYLGELK